MADNETYGTGAAKAPSAAAGTLATDANEVKVTPFGWIRERVHIGDGHYKWSEPFDPAVRAKEEAAAVAERMEHRLSGRVAQDKIDADNAKQAAQMRSPPPEKKL